jgi:hypothetical protein
LRLEENHPMNQFRQPKWNLMEIIQLQHVNNKFTCAVYFWLDNIFVGSITNFVVDTVKSYTAKKKYFLKGPKGRYIISLYTSIKILLYEKGVMTM